MLFSGSDDCNRHAHHRHFTQKGSKLAVQAAVADATVTDKISNTTGQVGAWAKSKENCLLMHCLGI